MKIECEEFDEKVWMDWNEKWGANASAYFGYTSTVGQDIFCRTVVRRHKSRITRDEGMIEKEKAMMLMIGLWRTKKGIPSNSTSFEWFITEMTNKKTL